MPPSARTTSGRSERASTDLKTAGLTRTMEPDALMALPIAADAAASGCCSTVHHFNPSFFSSPAQLVDEERNSLPPPE